MALHIKALNSDSGYFLTFIPSITPKNQKYPETFPGAFTILIDPYIPNKPLLTELVSPDQKHGDEPGITSLTDLPEPDVILISQAHPNHCHEDTLCQISSHVQSTIVASPQAANKISSWRHFDPGIIHTLRKYKKTNQNTIFRIEIPPPSPTGQAGELTIAFLAPKRAFSNGLHNAIGITYRAPTSVLSLSLATIPSVPTVASATQSKPSTKLQTNTSLSFAGLERTISVIYTSNGIAYPAMNPWVWHHLEAESALPLLALLHPTTVVNLPWYLGGNISTGCPGGLEIARKLLPTVWIAPCEEDTKGPGSVASKAVKKRYDISEVQSDLWRALDEEGTECRRPEIWRLEDEQTVRVDEKSVNKIGIGMAHEDGKSIRIECRETEKNNGESEKEGEKAAARKEVLNDGKHNMMQSGKLASLPEEEVHVTDEELTKVPSSEPTVFEESDANITVMPMQ